MTSPLHISGPYRAGTTFTALLVGNHPAFQKGPALHTTNWPRERHDSEDAAMQYAKERWGVTPEYRKKPVSRYDHPEAQRWHSVMRRLGFGSPWLEKTNLELSFTDTFLDWFPDGKVLAVIRDPRSILASFREYDYHDPPVYLQAAFVALHALQHVQRHGAYEMPADDRYLAVRYEDLAQSPEATLRLIVNWLDLDWPGRDVMLSTDGWQDVPGVQWQDRSSFADPEDIDVDRAVNRWKGNLSGDELKLVEWVCWEEMQAFGYETSRMIRPYPSQFSGLLREMRAHERTRQFLEHWMETGEGVEAFPEDPSDQETWRESNRESVA